MNRLKATKTLVIASVFLSCVSFFTSIKGYGEIYPFFFWKLFSQPIGSKGTDYMYRIYVKNPDGKLTRLPNVERRSFTQDDFMYAVSYYIEDSTAANRERLKTFCKYLYPGYSEYYIGKETYNAEEVIKKSDNYGLVFVSKIP